MQDRPLEAVFRPAMVLMTGRGLGFIAAFAIPMVLARVFTQEEFGTYKQLFLIYGTLFGIAQVGMAESLFYFLPNEKQRGGSYVVNTMLVLGGVGLACLAGVWLLQTYIAQLLNNPDLVDYIPFVGFYLLFMLMAVLLEITMTVRKQHKAASFAYAFSDLFRAILYITPVLLFSDLHWLMLGAVGFAAMRLGATLVYVLREFRGSLTPDKRLLENHLGYAIPFGFAIIIEVLQHNFHLYAVSYHFDVATFAIYAVGCLQIPLVDFLSSSTSNVMMTNMRSRMLDNDKAGACAIWLDTVRKLALILCPLVAGLVIMAYELITLLFTEMYVDSVPIFMFWTLGSLFTLLITDGVLRVLAETRFLILQNLIQLFLIVILIQWFLVTFGVIGAVLATILSTAICKAIAMWRIKTVLNLSLKQLLPWRSLGKCFFIATAAAVPALLIKTLFVMHSLPLLLITGSIYCLSYFALLLLCGPMDESEKQMLLQWIQSPFLWASRALRIS